MQKGLLGVCATAALSCIVAVAPAEAGTVSYDFAGAGPAAPATFGAGPTQVSVSAYESTVIDPFDFLFGNSRLVTQSADGLGVNGTGSLINNDPAYEVDGLGLNEFLRLDFATEVEMLSALITRVDSNGSDGVRVFNQAGEHRDFPGLATDPTTIHFAQPFRGTAFVFTVLGGNGFLDPNAKSDYSLGGVTVDGANAAPVPSAAWSGLAMLAVVGGAHARRRLRA